ncbi:hypothetical protein [Vibrio phage vB_VmeM-Yong XC32]|nr:hypothetical protein [Vibrio phage vB_VmeM-Yong XC31]QAX96401.1 hypothetical protein [Vibrio phage vB_VmeM-Yong XC32]QAX96718.1 hypothetical protein [Vibrio phage vB_VmeM-Yong MS31]QAX97037.1 hypothetical protein [Vibrio phage vB_VmeM-Yong MS32]
MLNQKQQTTTAAPSGLEQEVGLFLRSPLCKDFNVLGGLLAGFIGKEEYFTDNQMVDENKWITRAGLCISCDGEAFLISGANSGEPSSYVHVAEFPLLHAAISEWFDSSAMTIEEFEKLCKEQQARAKHMADYYLGRKYQEFEGTPFADDVKLIGAMSREYFDGLTVDNNGEWFHNLESGFGFRVVRFGTDYVGLDMYAGTEYVGSFPLRSFAADVSLGAHITFITEYQEKAMMDEALGESFVSTKEPEHFKPGMFRLGHGEWSIICFATFMIGLFAGKLL